MVYQLLNFGANFFLLWKLNFEAVEIHIELNGCYEMKVFLALQGQRSEKFSYWSSIIYGNFWLYLVKPNKTMV